MSSLRKTIVVRVILLVTAVGLAAAVMSFILVTLEMDKFLDVQLQETAANIDPGQMGGATSLAETEDEDHLVVQVWDRAGNLVHRSGPSADLPWQARLGLADVSGSGQDWRVYRLSHSDRNIQIAQRWSARKEIAMHAATGAALPFLAAIPLAWLMIGWSINRTLGGLRQLSAGIGRRSVDASEPLRPDGVPAEIAPLITAIDELVERHRQALEAQRRFVADAAHELRTPLAALQIQTENLIADATTGATRELLDELGSGVRRASRLADQLLEMARTEGAAAQVRGTVDLGALVTSVLPDFVPLAEAKDIELALDAGRTFVVETDPRAIHRLVAILLENAICYSAPGAPIEIRLGAVGSATRLEVVDSGPGIAPEAMPFIYDRFFRAAAQEIEGTGLGLAIAKKTAERNGLRLSHHNRSDSSGVVAVIEFPPPGTSSLSIAG